MPLITLKNSVSFYCEPSQTILEAAKKAGLTLEYSCNSGRCSSCEAEIIKGKSIAIKPELVSTQSESNIDKILTCCHSAGTDLWLNIEDIGDFCNHENIVAPCKLENISFLTNEIAEVKLRLPPSVKFKFTPGQYLNLKNKAGIKRSYSIANKPCDDGIVLHVKNYPNGKMSSYLFNHAGKGDLMQLEGPFGTFGLRNHSKNRSIFIANGTGIAPILSILSHENSALHNHEVLVFWGIKSLSDRYLSLKSLSTVDEEYLALSRQTKKSYFSGYVQDLVTSKVTNFEDCIVYACGSSKMINESKKSLVERGLDPSYFYSDAFVESN